jgi:5-formyltetrahydrofolate cyclo-ligase
MTPRLPNAKEDLRRQMRDRLKALSPKQRRDASARACDLLRQQKPWLDARAIFFYVPTPDELDLTPVLEETLARGTIVVLPRFVIATQIYEAAQISGMADCQPGKYGIPEPREQCPSFPLNRLDFTLVPGLGFDPLGHRLGKGRGFYDRLLERASGIKCGVAFDEQIVGRVPVTPLDIPMSCILTPSRWLRMP